MVRKVLVFEAQVTDLLHLGVRGIQHEKHCREVNNVNTLLVKF